MSDIWLIYSTFPTRGEAISAARTLVEKRLVACVNIHDITAVYRWEDTLNENAEAALVAKTSRGKIQAASEEIKKLHSYEVPCIVAYPVAGGYPPFLDWVAEETA